MQVNEKWAACLADQENGIAFFDGITITTDRLSDPRSDRVLPILEEEQILMCRLMERALRSAVEESDNNAGLEPPLVLDVGTGSGVFAIYAASLGCRVVAIDCSERAYNFAKYNIENNGISLTEGQPEKKCQIQLIKGDVLEFATNSDLQGKFDFVFLAPPYNPTCPGVFPALHATAGADGQECFKNQIPIAAQLLKKDGTCIGNQMFVDLDCSNNGKPWADIIESQPFSRGNYVHMLQDDHIKKEGERGFNTREFLNKQYSSFLTNENSNRTPTSTEVESYIAGFPQDTKFLLVYYELNKTSKTETTEAFGFNDVTKERIKQSSFPAKTWSDRIILHKKIVENTTTACSLPQSSLFLKSNNLPSFKYDGKKLEILDYIDRWIAKTGLVSEDVPFVLIDTAPWFPNKEGRAGLKQESRAWVHDTCTKSGMALHRGYQRNTYAQQKALTGPFLHKSFTSDSFPERWNNIQFTCSTNGTEESSVYSQTHADAERGRQIERIIFQVESINTENFKEPAQHTPATKASLINSYYASSNLEGFDVNVADLKNYDKAMLGRIGIPSSTPEQELEDLENCHYGMHGLLNKAAREHGLYRDKNAISFLVGIPIVKVIENRKRVEERDKLPASYRGGIWIYAIAHKTWTPHLENALSSLGQVLASLYADSYDLAAVSAMKAHAATAARAAIMSRNLSHNVGSHSLANSKFYDAVGVLNEAKHDKLELLEYKHPEKLGGKHDYGPTHRDVHRARQRLSTFNSFIQGRLDYIARALGESSSQPEPMFFYGDLLQGFLSQRVLLNTLLSDNGITIDEMEFYVLLPGMKEPAIYIGQNLNEAADSQFLRHDEFALKQGSPAISDILVAIPGGMVGRHAFFAFLENIMRNAAKYGTKSSGDNGDPSGRLMIRLDITEGKSSDGTDCYNMSVSDNRSLDNKGEITQTVRKHLNEPIITDEGKPQTQGHGIQEMKVCADFLASEQLHFPTDTELLPADKDATDNYQAWLATQDCEDTTFTRITAHNSLQAWQKKDPASDDVKLNYRLILQKPRLFGIVDTRNEAQPDTPSPSIRVAKENPTVFFYNSIETLAENSAHFGLVIVDNVDAAQKVLDDIVTYHHALPYRLMLVAQNEKTANDIQEKINDRSAGIDGRVYDITAKTLPLRRVFAVTCIDLVEKTSSPATFPEFQKTVANGGVGYKLFKSIYELWLKAWKKDELPSGESAWHLWVGLDRGSSEDVGSSQLSKWDTLRKFDSEILKVKVQTSDTNATPTTSKDYQGKFETEKSLIVYDNHGNVFGDNGANEQQIPEPSDLDTAPACYHRFSGSGQIDLFQSLETPPTDDFGFAFFIFSLIEASLLNVVVVDERVGEAMVEGGSLFGTKHRHLQLARIFPIFQIQGKTNKDSVAGLSPEIQNAVKYIDNVECSKTGDFEILDSESLATAEGLHFKGNQRIMPHVQKSEYEFGSIDSVNLKPDVLIVHEGIVDSIDADWKTHSFPSCLYNETPCFVRTSGRGAGSRHGSDQYPFLEFSELSNSTYQSLNKLSLGRSLMNLKGNVIK